MKRKAQELILLSRARQALEKARTVDELIDLRDMAELARAYMKKVGISQHIIVEASAIKLEAERKLGKVLTKLPLAQSSPGNQHTGKLDRSHTATGPICLRDLGITKSESSRTQQIATIPRSAFNRYVKENVEADREPTSAGALRLARKLEVEGSVTAQPHFAGGVVENLDELIEQGKKFSTIYADPPWPYKNQGTRAATGNHYPTMSIRDICAEPVAQLAADAAHLHLWTTNAFLREAFDVIEAWGFRYAGSLFTWLKPGFGIGNYWRVSTELMLLGRKGTLPFCDHSQRNWIEAKRTGHSRKPEVVRELVEKVSPPSYLEMYGRTPPPNPAWTVYGNQLQDKGQS